MNDELSLLLELFELSYNNLLSINDYYFRVNQIESIITNEDEKNIFKDLLIENIIRSENSNNEKLYSINLKEFSQFLIDKFSQEIQTIKEYEVNDESIEIEIDHKNLGNVKLSILWGKDLDEILSKSGTIKFYTYNQIDFEKHDNIYYLRSLFDGSFEDILKKKFETTKKYEYLSIDMKECLTEIESEEFFRILKVHFVGKGYKSITDYGVYKNFINKYSVDDNEIKCFLHKDKHTILIQKISNKLKVSIIDEFDYYISEEIKYGVSSSLEYFETRVDKYVRLKSYIVNSNPIDAKMDKILKYFWVALGLLNVFILNNDFQDANVILKALSYVYIVINIVYIILFIMIPTFSKFYFWEISLLDFKNGKISK